MYTALLLMEMSVYRGKDCVEKFVKHIEEEVKRLYAAFSQQPITRFTDALKREQICLKEFNDPKNKRVRDHCNYTGLYRGAQPTIIAT